MDCYGIGICVDRQEFVKRGLSFISLSVFHLNQKKSLKIFYFVGFALAKILIDCYFQRSFVLLGDWFWFFTVLYEEDF
jgi:hypothetical protein